VTALFGLNSDGFLPMRQPDVQADLEAAFRTAFGNNTRVDAQSVNGQIIGVMSERLADLWALLEQIYAAGFLDGATGAALDDLVAHAAITRKPATYSVATITLTGTSGTVPAGSIFADAAGTHWVTTADGSIGGTAPATEGAARLSRALSNVTDCLTVPTLRPDDLDSGEPGFHLIGSKSYGRARTFLLKTGLAQLEQIFERL